MLASGRPAAAPYRNARLTDFKNFFASAAVAIGSCASSHRLARCAASRSLPGDGVFIVCVTINRARGILNYSSSFVRKCPSITAGDGGDGKLRQFRAPGRIHVYSEV